ncbi:TIGR03751 family conjugal transfer lipoprotein [Pseudomonas sp. NS1(2017)]|uniref:TIGR03751 family conjugal transfer lipoprotein n=1 Tax=Pseudomonas sp. NS1(2017) TaxID=2025658 RepID=UPI000BA2B9BF|nr:TIGR03751 family conjugal transfer lipoprotein [Pseudomonas sp. NS1(2017)]ASV39766.1 TIGR03751 family conjugal transfer lipoprotein [Pseudomonas sp. NS1(2017)]
MYPRSINTWPLILFSMLAVSGCTTDKDKLLPHGQRTMVDIWDASNGYTPQSSADRQLNPARSTLHRSLNEVPKDLTAYTRTAENEIDSQFKRLPNPDLVMYVFPHLAGSDPVPVPGYSTVFPFYQRVQYAMPGERTEEY